MLARMAAAGSSSPVSIWSIASSTGWHDICSWYVFFFVRRVSFSSGAEPP